MNLSSLDRSASMSKQAARFVALVLLTVVLLGIVAISGAAANEVVTASHLRLPTTTGAFNTIAGMAGDGPQVFDNRTAQSFAATETGYLSGVAFVASRLTATVPLKVELTRFVAGQPSTSLASGFIAPAEFYEGFLPGPPDLNTFLDLSSSNALVEAGETYALLFSTESSDANYRLYGASFQNVPTNDPYPNGDLLHSQNGSLYTVSQGLDLYFEVEVAPVPEPSTAGLLAIGTCQAGFFRRFVRRLACRWRK